MSSCDYYAVNYGAVKFSVAFAGKYEYLVPYSSFRPEASQSDKQTPIQYGLLINITQHHSLAQPL